MSSGELDPGLEYLIGEIEQLADPTHLAYVFRDATGSFLPGFMALPGVTILAHDTWKARTEPSPEHWQSGDLIALSSAGQSEGDASRVFFTPVGELTIPLVDVTPAEGTNPWTKSFLLRPVDRWDVADMQFAVLPWSTERDAASWSPENILAISPLMPHYARDIRVELEVDGRRVEVMPDWGLSSPGLDPALESIRFPLNHAWEMLSGFMLRVPVGRSPALEDAGIMIDRQPINVHIGFSADTVRRLIDEAGVSAANASGVSVFANALPLANVDLKAWPTGDPFETFIRDAGMKPLGVAGVFPYKRVGSITRLDLLDGHANRFSMELDRNGIVLTRYSLPGDHGSTSENQLVMWMTSGPRVNGKSYAYEKVQIRQPMERSSEILVRAGTVVPCFGGMECQLPEQKDAYGNLMLNVSAAPQMFAFRDGLKYAVRDLVSRVGYEHVEVDGPHSELRVIDGTRQRAIVISLINRSGRRLEARHLHAIQSYVRDRSPMATPVIVEESA